MECVPAREAESRRQQRRVARLEDRQQREGFPGIAEFPLTGTEDGRAVLQSEKEVGARGAPQFEAASAIQRRQAIAPHQLKRGRAPCETPQLLVVCAKIIRAIEARS